MSKPKVSPEARVIEYFETAPVEMANVILGIVKARVRARTPVAAKAKPARKAKVNAKPAGSPATSFDTSKIEAAS